MTIGQSTISISHLGLTERDLTFITNLFRLGASQLANYQLIPSQNIEQAQIVLINADSPESVAFWTDQRRHQINCPAIWISSASLSSNGVSTGTSAFGNTVPIASSPSREDLSVADSDITVSRPLVSKKILTALKNISAHRSESKDENINTKNAVSVLVVDDSEPMQRYLGLKLPQLVDTPLTLDFAANGELAIEKTNQRHYDLIFLDVTMPGIDGYKTCKAIKSQGNGFVVMLTSNKSPFDRIRGTMSGCNAYITKPPDDEKLMAAFRKMLAQKNAQQNAPPRPNLNPLPLTGA